MPDAQSGGAGTGSADNRVVRSFRQGPLRKRPRGGQRGSHAVAVNLGIAQFEEKLSIKRSSFSGCSRRECMMKFSILNSLSDAEA